jgi:hypothetical protein
VVAGEAGKLASAALGAKIGAGVGALAGGVGAAPGAAIGGGIGYVIGALSFGAGASIAAQRFEGREVSTGRTIRDTLINLIPGSKLARGVGVGQRIISAGGRQAAIGAGIGAVGTQIETIAEERRLATIGEMTFPTIFGAFLGGGLGAASETTRALVQRYSRMSPARIEKELFKGRPDTSMMDDAINEATNGALNKTGVGLKREVLGFFQGNPTLAKMFPTISLGKRVTGKVREAQDRLAAAPVIGKKDANILDSARERIGDITMPDGLVIARGSARHQEVVNDTISDMLLGRTYRDPISGNEFKGITDMPRWMQPMRREITEVRAQIRAGSQYLIDADAQGKIVLPQRVKAAIQESINTDGYLTTKYQFFNDPGYKPSAAAEKKLLAALMREGRTEGGKAMNATQAKEFIANLQAKRADTSIDGVLRNMVSPFSGPRGQLKQKKVLEKAYAEYLGEVKDPISRVDTTIKNLFRLRSQIEGDTQVGRMLSDQGIARTAAQIPPGQLGNYVPLELSGGSIHRVEAGNQTIFRSVRDTPKDIAASQRGSDELAQSAAERLYVPREAASALTGMYANAIQEMSGNVTENIMLRMFRQGIGLSKFAKVPLNPPAWMIQFYGSWMGIFTNGFNPFNRASGIRGVEAAAQGFNSIGPKFYQRAKNFTMEDIRRFQERGLLNQSVIARDALAAFEGGRQNLPKRVLQKLGAGYSFADDMHRIQQFLMYENTIQKSFGRATSNGQSLFSKAEMADIAETLTHATYQNYSRLPQFLRTLSQYGALSQFASFPLELVRNYWNKAWLSKAMVDGSFVNDMIAEKVQRMVQQGMTEAAARRAVQGAAQQIQPQIAQQGYRMIAAQATAYAGVTATVYGFNRAMGTSREEEKAIRETYLPPWDRASPLALWRTEDGKIHWMNMTYLTEVAQIANTPAAFAQGLIDERSLPQAFAKGAEAFLNPIIGQGPFVTQHLNDAIQNQMPLRDRRISSATNPWENRLERTTWYLGQTFMPGVIREFERATSLTREQPISQTAKRQLGIRVNDTTEEQALRFRTRDIRTDLNTIKGEWGISQYRLAGGELDQAYNRLNQSYKDNFGQLIQVANNLRILGKDNDTIIRELRAAGTASMDALHAVNGKAPDLPRTRPESPAAVWNELSALSPREREQEIRKIVDPRIKRDVMRRHKREIDDTRRGLGEAEKVLRGQDVPTRARHIYMEMQQSDNPQQVLIRYRRMGIVTDDVNRQIRLLQRGN